jgi:nitroreductase
MARHDLQDTAWQVRAEDFPLGDMPSQLAFLVRYAILAPSTHNTQPWRFEIGSIGHDEIRVFVDDTRQLKIADHDGRELYVSVGCALESLLIAAGHFGLDAHVTCFPRPALAELIAQISFKRASGDSRPSGLRGGLLAMIPVRRTNHRLFSDQFINAGRLSLLKQAGREDGVETALFEERGTRIAIEGLTRQADALQFADPAFRQELGYWIGQGAFGTSWLMAKAGQLAVSALNLGARVADIDTDRILSAAVIGVTHSAVDNRIAQVRAGQAFMRLALRATQLGIGVQPMNQVLQIPSLKQALADALNLGSRTPQMLFRLGYALPEEHRTPRRPVDDVLA